MSLFSIITGIIAAGGAGGGSTPPDVPDPPQPPTSFALQNEVVSQTNGQTEAYNMQPSPIYCADYSVLSFFKRSETHAVTGPFIIARRTQSGYQERQFSVGGVNQTGMIICATPMDGYIYISYQTQVNTNITKYARILESSLTSSFMSATFQDCGSITHTQEIVAPHGRMLKMPDGALIWVVYSFNNALTQSKCFAVESANGTSWSLSFTILEQSSMTGYYPNQITSECFAVIVEGTTRSNTKIVAFHRNETVTDFTHNKSLDGGATWTNGVEIFDWLTAHTGENPAGKQPISVIRFNNTWYIVGGMRYSSGYVLAYCTVNTAGLLSNSGYSAVTVLAYNGNADQNGQPIDFGYPELFIKGNELWCHFYDTAAVQGSGGRDCEIHQYKIAEILP